MPFANARGRITGFLQNFRDSDLLRVQPVGRYWSQHVAVLGCPVQPHAARVATSHQCRAARRAHATGAIKTCEPPPLSRHTIEIRRPVEFAPKRFNIAIAQVVGHDENEVGLRWRDCRLGINRKYGPGYQPKKETAKNFHTGSLLAAGSRNKCCVDQRQIVLQQRCFHFRILRIVIPCS